MQAHTLLAEPQMPGKSKVCPGIGGREVGEVILWEFGLVCPDVIVSWRDATQ
jgi:hypothetical protein